MRLSLFRQLRKLFLCVSVYYIFVCAVILPYFSKNHFLAGLLIQDLEASLGSSERDIRVKVLARSDHRVLIAF